MIEDDEACGLTEIPLISLDGSFTALSAFGVLPKSRADPGVLGVLLDDPNDAKTPEPKPNADDAPLVGDATLFVERGVIPLSGLVLLLKESKRFAG